jgi:hypothetical protein
MQEDIEIIQRLNRIVEKMGTGERNLDIPIEVLKVQSESKNKKLGQFGAPIYCKVRGLNKDDNEGSLISNGDWTFFVDDVSQEEEPFVKLYLFGAEHIDFVEADEFKKDFIILC